MSPANLNYAFWTIEGHARKHHKRLLLSLEPLHAALEAGRQLRDALHVHLLNTILDLVCECFGG